MKSKTKTIASVLSLIILMLVFTGCLGDPINYTEPPNNVLIYVKNNGSDITSGTVFADYGKVESTRETLRQTRPCIEVSWIMNEIQVDCYSTDRIVKYGQNGYAFCLVTDAYSSLYENDTVLKLTYYPETGDPMVVENADLHWFDPVLRMKCFKFTADFGTGEFRSGEPR